MPLLLTEYNSGLQGGPGTGEAGPHSDTAYAAAFAVRTPPMLMGGSMVPRRLEVPDHRMELRVLFFGPDAQHSAGASSGSVQVADAKMAAMACEGKRDFILFEPLDGAVKENRRLVLVLPLSAGSRDIKQAQAYLASSLASWLKEQKTDGSGRPYGECKDEDPTLRMHFTRAQILAIRAFGDLDQ